MSGQLVTQFFTSQARRLLQKMTDNRQQMPMTERQRETGTMEKYEGVNNEKLNGIEQKNIV